jgi:hypothetical protein
MLRVLFLSVFLLSSSSKGVQAQEFLIWVEKIFRHGVVKIIVYDTDPIIEGGVNKCSSEGTGFVVNRHHIVSALHVLTVDPRCTNVKVLIRSQLHNYEAVAQIKGESKSDDLVLLEIAKSIPPKICSLVLRGSNSHGEPGYRIGIPKGFQNPRRLSLETGAQDDNEFEPFVKIQPFEASYGESGSPIFVKFNVVGVMHARHTDVGDLNLMIKREYIYNLMSKLNIITSKDDICDLTEAATVVITSSAQLSANMPDPQSPSLRPQPVLVAPPPVVAAPPPPPPVVAARPPPVLAAPPPPVVAAPPSPPTGTVITIASKYNNLKPEMIRLAQSFTLNGKSIPPLVEIKQTEIGFEISGPSSIVGRFGAEFQTEFDNAAAGLISLEIEKEILNDLNFRKIGNVNRRGG